MSYDFYWGIERNPSLRAALHCFGTIWIHYEVVMVQERFDSSLRAEGVVCVRLLAFMQCVARHLSYNDENVLL